MTTEADQVYRRVAWRLIPFLMLCYFCAYVDRSNIGIAKLQFTKDVGITEAMYGLGGGLFYLGYIFVELPSNLILARFGARATIARIMVIWSLTSAAFALVTHAWQFYGLRLLLGAAEAGFFPGVVYYLSMWAPAERRARMTGLFMAAMALSGVVIGPISGQLMKSMAGVGGLAGWQWLFILEGLPGVFLGVAAWFYLSDAPAKAKWLSEPQKALIAADLAAETAAKKASPAHKTSFLAALKEPRFYGVALMASAQMSSVAGISLWLPTILKSTGVTDVAQIGLMAAVPYICAVVVQQLVARSSDRTGERRWHSIIPTAVAAAGWLMLPLVSHSPWLSLLMMTLATAGIFGSTGPFWIIPTANLSGTAAAGGLAVVTTFGSMGAFLSPIIVGWFAGTSGNLAAGLYYGLFQAMGCLSLFAATRAAPRLPATFARKPA